MATVYNPTDSPVPISADGRHLGGDESAEVDLNDPVVARALGAGRLTDISNTRVAVKRPAESEG